MAAEMHELASDLHKSGVISKRRMAEYDELCLVPVPEYDAAAVKALRKKLNVSQAVLADAINASASSVRAWEGGDKKPTGTAAKLLNLLDRKGLEAIL
ncbi:helix-turn-helix domain-containing protein [Paraburkholderia sp. BCC1886]|uniref:helix-turn-helix domain-containing protein n=1 Tax=Paraburkholderia sp. BCC1886 TaxID=2562670 RepID=UPI0021B2E3BB|nr:helix-turn-helix domain-containing protein [Paraburkholderia sp. BCC1886]